MNIPSRNSRLKFLFAGLLLILLFFAGIVPNVYAEGMSDPAPELQPAMSNGKRVLFDNMHGQTAGAADWVIDGAFSDFADAISRKGYFVKELRKQTPLTYGDLSTYDVFVIPEANVPFKKSEQNAMLEYVQKGGSIFFISDHYNADRNKNRWDSSEVMNGYRRGAWEDPAKGMSAGERASTAMQGVENSDWLSNHFGIRFRYNALGDANATIIKPASETFGITKDVSSVAIHAGSTLMITDPAKAKGLVYVPEGMTKWNHAVDQGVYFNGGIEEGPYAAIAKSGKGKAAFIGDSSPVEDATPKYTREENGQQKKTYDGFKEADDAVLLVQMIEWLAKQEDYNNFVEVGFPLDQVSPQLNQEIPENSTEPKAEPWAEPAPGYLWYDTSTFAPGSFGSTVAPVKQADYTVVNPNILPNNLPFTIEVKATNLEPGQVVGDLNTGIYNPTGGAQLAKVKRIGEAWPSAYGYSNLFSLTADDGGTASIKLEVQLNPNFNGEARLRLRSGKTNLLTKDVKITAAESETGPETGTPPVEDTSSSIDKALKSELGSKVTVKGRISTKPGLLESQGFYIQDEAAGIFVYQKNPGYRVGDLVEVAGEIQTYRGRMEIFQVEKIQKLESGERPEPKIAEAATKNNLGLLIKIKNAEVQDIRRQQGTRLIAVKSADETTIVELNKNSHSHIKKGDILDVSGISTEQDDKFILRVTATADLKVKRYNNKYKQYYNKTYKYAG